MKPKFIRRWLAFWAEVREPEIQVPFNSYGVRVMDAEWLRETFRNRERYIEQSANTRYNQIASLPEDRHL